MTTILHSLADWADKDPTGIAQKYLEDGQWKPITVREYADRVYALALYLESKGMTTQDISVIVSYNCPEWVHLDLAPMLMGAKSAGAYPNSTAKDIHYVLNHTETKFLFVQNKEYFKKMGYEFKITVCNKLNNSEYIKANSKTYKMFGKNSLTTREHKPEEIPHASRAVQFKAVMKRRKEMAL